MDTELWKLLLNHLLSKAQVSDLLKGLPEADAGALHIVIGGDDENPDARKLVELLKALTEHSGAVVPLVDAIGIPDGMKPNAHIVAFVINAGDVEKRDAPVGGGPRTLRDSIDRHWPW